MIGSELEVFCTDDKGIGKFSVNELWVLRVAGIDRWWVNCAEERVNACFYAKSL